MALNPLFNLDPTRFELGRGSGTFRRVAPTRQRPDIDIASLVAGLNVPAQFTAQAPDAPEPSQETVTGLQNWDASMRGWIDNTLNLLKTYNPYNIDPVNLPRTMNDKWALAELGRGKDYFVQQRARDYLSSGYKTYLNNMINITGEYESQKAAMAPTFAARDAYNQQAKDYLQQVETYNQSAQAYKGEVEAYNKRKAEIFDPVYAQLVDPSQVTDEASGTRGEALGASELYSDQLHSMMLDRISSQPIIDQVSTLFSGGNK